MGIITARLKTIFNHYACIFGLLLLVPATVKAQQKVVLQKLNNPLVFDGKLDESFWAQMQPLNMTMYLPVYQGKMSEKSEIYLVYDHQYMYLAARLYYRDTGDIRSNSLYRDQYSSGDTFALILDTFNDNENAVWFFTNPDGNRSDALVSDDAGQTNFDWNTFWDVRTKRHSWGVSVEMRVPFASLGFQSKNGEVTMGAIVYRYLSKRNERYIYPAIPPNWENGFRKPSQAQKILLQGIESKNPVYVRPYLLGGFKQTSELNTGATGYRPKRDWTREAGLDVKMNLTSNLTVDLTANTDFAQVEADNQQVNLTRFPLFFPEKRQFFQERSSVFNFAFSRNSRLFHSRRIGLSATGKPIRIYGGARAVGKFGQTDVGFINMQTAASGNLPSENFNVLRVKRKIFNRYSTIGGMFTSRIGNYQNGSDNYAYGLDAVIRVVGDEYLTLKAAQTYQGEELDILENSRLYFLWQRRRDNGLSYELTYDRSGKNFDPKVGFVTRSDFTLTQNKIAYKWVTDASPIFQEISIDNFTNAYTRNADRQVESAVINPHAGFKTKGGTSFRMQTNIRYENLLQPFYVSGEQDVFVPAGTYWYQDLEFNYRPPNGWMFRPELRGGWGGFFDGSRLTLNLSAKWNLSPHLEIGSEYEYNNVRFSKRSQRLDTHIMRFRFRAALNTKVSLSSFTQYNSEADKISLNARFRYNFSEGDDLWIVYDNLVNTQRRQIGLPMLPASGYQALLVKFTHTFIF